MKESEFRSRLHKLFDNNYIYNNPLSDEIDIIINELIKNNYSINHLLYRELLGAFTVKTCLQKTGINPIVYFSSMDENTKGSFCKIDDYYVLTLNTKHLKQENILLNMEVILHEIQHIYQTLGTHYDATFHYMIKDTLLAGYFGRKYDNDNYPMLSFERDAFITSRDEMLDYVDTNTPGRKEYFDNLTQNEEHLYNRIVPDSLCDYRHIKKGSNNFKEYKTYRNIDQIFDKFMLENKLKVINNDSLKYSGFDKDEVKKALSMQYNSDGTLKSNLDFIKMRCKYNEQIDKTENDDKKRNYEYLMNVYDSFVTDRFYTPVQISKELVDFAKYKGKDKNIIEEMYLAVEMFTDIILNGNMSYEYDYNKIIIKQSDIDFIDYSINELNKYYNIDTVKDNELKKYRYEMYVNSLEILNYIKQDMIEKMSFCKRKIRK